MDAIWLDRLLSTYRKSDPLFSAREGLKVVPTQAGLVRIRAVGSGDTAVVFVCDSPALIEHYDGLIERLRSELRVICIELPGLGLSSPSDAFDFGLAAQAQAVREVLEAEQVSSAILAFGCVGAYLALLLAHELGNTVKGVVLIQAPSWDEEQVWARRIDFRGRGLLAKPLLGQLLVAASRRTMAKRWFQKALGDPALVQEFLAQTERGFAAGSHWALASLVQALFTRPAPKFQPVEQKSLVVWGALDRTHRKSDPRSALAYLPRGELVTFERSGHFPELEESERFAQLLCKFAEAC